MTDEIGAEVKSILSERETWEQVETVAELLLKNKKVTPEMLRVTGPTDSDRASLGIRAAERVVSNGEPI